MHHSIVVSTQNKNSICTDDQACTYKSCDPALLLRHRKRLHNYVSTSRCKTRTSLAAESASSSQALNPAPLRSEPESSIIPLLPNILPFGETSSLPPMQLSLQYYQKSLLSLDSPPPWDGVGFYQWVAASDLQMNRSHNWFGPLAADPTQTHGPSNGYQNHENYAADLDFRSSSSFANTSALTQPTYSPSSFFDHSLYQHRDDHTSGDYINHCWWDFASDLTFGVVQGPPYNGL